MSAAADSNAPAGQSLTLRVNSVRWQTERIHEFELTDPSGSPLPAFDAGAHINVQIPGGITRSYSLAGCPQETTRWTLGVLHEANGRGGSRAMHEQVRVGQQLTVSAPANAFGLDPQATHSVLLAGGVGITPIKSMAHQLVARGQSFELHYCARSEPDMAFLSELRELVPAAQLHLHADNGEASRHLDIKALLKQYADGTHLYYCGPTTFMDACEAASAHWPDGTVHFERFAAPVAPAAAASNGAFEIQLAKSGASIQVEPGQTIIDALESAGHRVPTSCMSGLCGTCKVGYLSGDVEHNDYILSDEEKQHSLTLCCSRASSATLVLDL